MLTCLKVIGRASDLLLAQYTHFPINVVTARRNSLVKKGFVVSDSLDLNPLTKKRVMYWKVKA